MEHNRLARVEVIWGLWPSMPILMEPPFLCIEILSRPDSVDDLQERIDDYLEFGVPHVWVVNPRKLRAFHHTVDGMREAKDGVLRTSNQDIEVPILELEQADL